MFLGVKPLSHGNLLASCSIILFCHAKLVQVFQTPLAPVGKEAADAVDRMSGKPFSNPEKGIPL